MASLKEIQAQIAELQRQAEEQRGNEFSGAIKEIKNLMADYGITADDLQSNRKKGVAKTSVVVQFRHPSTGDTWSGRGRKPHWLAGQNKEQFRV